VSLVAIGVVLVFDASFAQAAEMRLTGHDSWYFVKRQLAFAIAGMLGLLLAMRADLSFYRKLVPYAMVATIGLLVAVLIPGIGDGANGAARWIKVGPVKLQPSELAKLAVVLYLADALARQNKRVRYLGRGVVWHLLWVGVIAGLVLLEPDMGTAVVLTGIAFVMLFAAGALKRHLFGLGAFGMAGAAVLAAIEPYRWERIKVFLNPLSDYYGSGYQIVHSLIALATGGVRGVGLIEGREKYYLPAAHTDFIFATVAEEAGLIGGLILLAVFAYYTYRGLQIARDCRSTYGTLLAAGMTSVVAVQTVINVGVVASLVPATGVPLPFISYGGSSLFVALVSAGILLSVSRNLNEQMVEDAEANESSIDWGRHRGTYISRPVRRAGLPGERRIVRDTVRR